MKFVLDFAEEENWLNKMAAQGRVLKQRGAFGRYYFNEAQIGDSRYFIDEPNAFTKEFTQSMYLKTMEQAGFKYLFLYGNRYYFIAPSGVYINTKRYENRTKRILNDLAFFTVICVVNLFYFDLRKFLFKLPPFSVVPSYLTSFSFAYNSLSNLIIITITYLPIALCLICLVALAHNILLSLNRK